ncbi:MAG TPA: hypothetical protein VGC05_14500 [Mycobacterium sp.]
MTAHQHPHSLGQQQRSTADVIATAVLLAVDAAAAVGSLWISLLFTMATDPCGPDNCNTAALDWAYLVTWGGIGVAAVIAIVGTAIAAKRRRVMWVWPAAALVLIIVAVVAGALLAGSVSPHR